MKRLLILLLFCLRLSAYELSENYEFTDYTVYSDDLVPNIPKKFEILQIPADKNQYRIDAQIIAKTFELNGFELNISKTRYINFTRHSPIDFTPIKQQLAQMLTEFYPTIHIQEIIITPRGYLAKLGKNVHGEFDKRFYQNATGTFYILDNEGLRHYLDYTVNATLGVLHTNQKVSRKESLNGFNTLLKTIPFQSFKDKPLTALPAHPSRFRSSLKPMQLLTLRNIEEIPLVLKNTPVTVELQNGAVVIEFEATATQEGLLYDIITIQKNDGKRAKAKVIGENRVELQ
ncbi:flagellar basal body P-ring formation chaperone FlgA [Sulfuricurvum sp.]|uniref:flagellar basal body P-ring formation chaperone FlgA n=1 Tax=Sulfuricurvum sp. TaxID=2025608 RepID=UPI00262F3F3A|nr:flagellar basal body P-ring formation chaperone FlgA [Sulfuricurvum sp.]MDD2267125.1 flagellar basal body P-ring formation chaperone FlgA [Sulfuricurvum sp.]MDD2784832.1 flagellar basal body P-ring formation chaperone FlgA [Sulfuricurvum sp.]